MCCYTTAEIVNIQYRLPATKVDALTLIGGQTALRLHAYPPVALATTQLQLSRHSCGRPSRRFDPGCLQQPLGMASLAVCLAVEKVAGPVPSPDAKTLYSSRNSTMASPPVLPFSPVESPPPIIGLGLKTSCLVLGGLARIIYGSSEAHPYEQ